MKNKWQILFLLLSGVIFIMGCDCDDPTDSKCSNYDPCYEVAEVKANFNFYEGIGDTLIQTDTVLNLHVTFKAEEEYDKVKWLIGDDPREWTDEQFTLIFRDTGTYKITLMVERTPNKGCFPNDDGLDTLVKYFTRLGDLGDNHPIIGDYHGYLASNPEDTFTVNVEYELKWQGDPTDPSDKKYFVFNINKGCNTNYVDVLQISEAYRALYINGLGYTGDGCKQVRGYVFAGDYFNSVTIPFNYIDPNSVWPNYVYIYEIFHGVRR